MHIRSTAGQPSRASPLNAASFRILFASAVGVLICLIWVTGTLGDSHRVTPLALSAVSLLGLGLVLELRRRFTAEVALSRAKEEAEQANRAKSQFLATISHELRTPLNGIMGFAEIIKSEVMGPIGNPHYRVYAADIHEGGAHLLQVINDILDLTKAEAGKLELDEDTIDVAEVVQAVIRVSRSNIDKAGLTLDASVPAGLRLRADERRVRQILFNLIGNAVKFTPEGGTISITAQCDMRTGARIIVADTGIGIAPQDLSRVLEPFVQIDSTLSRRHVGTGLGLPAVKAMMELHGGRLEITSEARVGTQAIAIFPPERIVEKPPGPAVAPRAPLTPVPSTSR